ncbi:MAG: nucleotidyl transferase AbiEii/AbiGii toxin family protein [Cytophagia bacterium]|nr:nucleotidyl transferase AbiEii/AbiGii toxin family protein [Cytophagia bacterium]NBW35864.1 nucleotidyl transferase AbiEii/AbiGii toxin family protein [Cytophagia bacterium]
MIRPEYRAQVDLLLSILPHVAKEDSLALKGGTAINLFIRDMPRLSVDIDLTYLSWQDDRATALQNITAALDRIEERIKRSIRPFSVTRVPVGQGQDVKLNCQTPTAQVKIEVNTTTRGILFPERMMPISDAVQNEFKKFAAMKVVSHAELYGGKICAALDRQHPRDIFDIHYLLKNEGFSNDIKQGFLFFLLSHARPMHELINPKRQAQKQAFENQFSGMTAESFTYENYESVREQLIIEVNKALTEDDKQFLLTFKNGEPDWQLLKLDNLQYYPAIQWKLQNIQTLAKSNKSKHADLLKRLEDILVA